jgi:hypothetical protein
MGSGSGKLIVSGITLDSKSKKYVVGISTVSVSRLVSGAFSLAVPGLDGSIGSS